MKVFNTSGNGVKSPLLNHKRWHGVPIRPVFDDD